MANVGLQPDGSAKLIVAEASQRFINVIKPSTVSSGKLRTSLPLHIRPINLVVYQGSSAQPEGEHRVLISGTASRLDAFSGYPFRA